MGVPTAIRISDAILPPMDGLLLTDLIGDARESAQE